MNEWNIKRLKNEIHYQKMKQLIIKELLTWLPKNDSLNGISKELFKEWNIKEVIQGKEYQRSYSRKGISKDYWIFLSIKLIIIKSLLNWLLLKNGFRKDYWMDYQRIIDLITKEWLSLIDYQKVIHWMEYQRLIEWMKYQRSYSFNGISKNLFKKRNIKGVIHWKEYQRIYSR